MSEQENIKVAHSFFEAWNVNDLSKATPYEADNMKVDAPGAPGPMTSEQSRKYNQNFLSAFPGSKFEFLVDVVQGDYVVTNWKINGKHSGPLYSPSGTAIPPTGKTVTVVGSTTSLIKNGKLVHSSTFWDMSSLLAQLGLLPPM
jgi:predicted ester cyclase